MRWIDLPLCALLPALAASCFSPDGSAADDGTTGDTSADGGSVTTPTTSGGPDGDSGDDAPGDGTTSEPTDATVGPMDTTSPPDGCEDDSQCTDVRAPFCQQGECVPCSDLPLPDSGCAQKFPNTPYCAGSLCVGCTEDAQCGAEAPICDPVEQACTGCRYHEHCPDSACDVFDGNCLPADAVWWVDLDCSNGNSGVGSEASPFCTFEEALEAVPPGAEGTFMLAQSISSAQLLSVDEGRTIAVIATNPTGQTISVLGAGIPVNVDNATVYLQGIRYSGGAPVNIDASDGARVAVDRCRVAIPQESNIRLANSQLLFRTSMLTHAGFSNGIGVGIAAIGSEVDILYSSLVRSNPSVGGTVPDAIVCDLATAGTVRNSIIFEDGDPPVDALDCPGLNITHSATNEFVPGRGNVQIDIPLDYGIFVNLENDFHLDPDGSGISLFDGVAQWEYGDPTTDYDGDLRPTSPGPDYAGVDIPMP